MNGYSWGQEVLSMTKVHIVFYSMYGHIYKMAQAIQQGARKVPGCTAELYQVPETLPDEVLEKVGARKAKEDFSHVAIATPSVLEEGDAIIFGTPTRFGMMTAQMRSFLDHTGQQWISGSLIGKVASVFTSSATQHGGQESTILSFHTTLLHHGMIIAGVPCGKNRIKAERLRIFSLI